MVATAGGGFGRGGRGGAFGPAAAIGGDEPAEPTALHAPGAEPTPQTDGPAPAGAAARRGGRAAGPNARTTQTGLPIVHILIPARLPRQPPGRSAAAAVLAEYRRRPRRHRHRPARAQPQAHARRLHPHEHPDQGSALAHAGHARLQLLRQTRRAPHPLARHSRPHPAQRQEPLHHHRLGQRRVRPTLRSKARNVRLIFKPRADALPEHIIDRLTQAKDNYANMVEEAVSSERLNTWNRFYADITDLLRVDPDQRPRPQVLVRRQQERSRSRPYTQPTVPANTARLGLAAGQGPRLLQALRQLVHRQPPDLQRRVRRRPLRRQRPHRHLPRPRLHGRRSRKRSPTPSHKELEADL